MKLNFFKRTLPEDEIATQLLNLWNEIKEREEIDLLNYDRQKFLRENKWDYDKKQFSNEYPHIKFYIFMDLIFSLSPDNNIFTKFRRLLGKEALNLLTDLPEYLEIAGKFHNSVIDERKFKNILYELSKFCTTRCFGEEDGINKNKILMFSAYILSIHKIISDFLDNYKIKTTKKVIIILEDEYQLRSCYVELLKQKFGVNFFEIFSTGDAEYALEVVENKKGKIDIIFADITLPIMDGITFSKIIKEKYPYIKVIIGTSFESEEKNSRAEKVSDFLIKKPVQINEFIDIIKNCINK